MIDIIDNYDSSKSKFTTFLFGIALNKSRQKWSKDKAYKTFFLNEDLEIEQVDDRQSDKRKKLTNLI